MGPFNVLVALFLTLLPLLPANAEPTIDEPPGESPAAEIVLFTWADYLDPQVASEFERELGVRVRQVYFENDEVRDGVMAQTGGAEFDLLLLDNTSLEAYRKRGWIAPIDAAAIPNRRFVASRWEQAYPYSSGYAVPYLWGTLGIAYRRDLIGRDLDSWMDLLRPEEDLAGRMLMSADSLDLIGMALKALGHSMNSADPEALAAARDLLLRQKPAVYRYGALAVNAQSELLSGVVAAAMTYNGDAAALMEENDAVVYVVPKEGGALWVDYLAIAAKSGRKDLAATFIDYMNRPRVAARNAEALHYATPNAAAEALLPEGVRSDPLVYPDAPTLARCETYARLPPEALRRRVQAYASIVFGK
jgi:spermidine/putrescine transport system substrate-binding protein